MTASIPTRVPGLFLRFATEKDVGIILGFIKELEKRGEVAALVALRSRRMPSGKKRGARMVRFERGIEVLGDEGSGHAAWYPGEPPSSRRVQDGSSIGRILTPEGRAVAGFPRATVRDL